ncbi:MAG: VWA domain-containing protein [Acidobacteriota bacterium]
MEQDRSTVWKYSLVMSLVLLPLAAALIAQEELPPLTEEVELRVVNVDVVVVDRKGEPIRGLEKGDFELFEDGKPVEITNFFTYAEPDPPAIEDREWAENDGSGIDIPPSREPLVLAIYLDENNVPPFARKRILQDLAPVLEAWAVEGAQFLYLRRANRLLVEAGPTSNPQDVLAALSSDPATTRGVEVQLEYQRALEAIEAEYVGCANSFGCDPCDNGFPQLVALARRYAEEQQARLETASFGAADVVSVLSGVRGRKAVLYITEALPQSPGLAVFNMLGQVCPERIRDGDQNALEYDETTRLNVLASQANANRVVFYTLDAGGLRGFSAADASGPSFGSSGSSSTDPLPSFIPSARIDNVRITNLQNSLFQIADETGGKAILNANRPREDLIRMRDDLLSTYSLGFVPQHERTGRIHLLEVRLKDGRKARLRYRKAYRDKDQEELLGERLLSKLYLSKTDRTAQADNPLGVSLSIGEARRLNRRSDTLPVEIRLSRSAVTVLPGGSAEAPVARLRVWMTALGSRGHLPLRQELIEFTADDVRLEDDFLSFVVDIDLRREKQTLGVGLRDEISGEESLAVVEMEFDASS